ncbi:MAG: ABC transporter permease [Dehalococcoidales bacterium]|nr:ABC transporter permease [Dehalococcoidales bacterium]
MNDLEKLRIVIRYEFLKHIRRRRLWIIMGLALIVELAVLILIPVLQDGYPDNVMIMAALLTFGPALAALGAVFFAGDAIAGEFENKTGFLLFTNPVKKLVLWSGKYLAGYIAVGLMIIFAYAIVTISLLVIYGEVPFETLKSFGLCMLYAGAVLSVTFFFSAVSKGSMGATVITLVFIWVISGILESVLGFTGNPYWFLISAQGDSVALVYGGMEAFLGAFGGDGMASMMEGFEELNVGQAAMGMVIYLVVGFVASVWIAGRRQLA